MEARQSKLAPAVPDSTKNGTASISMGSSHQCLLLLCSEDSLRVYYISSLLKGVCSPSLKVRFDNSCCWTSTFQTPSDRVGLILVYKTGQIEFRCLPDLKVLKSATFDNFLKWQVEPNLSFLRTISCTVNGQIALVDCDREVLFWSVLDKKHDLRLPVFSQSFCPKPVTRVTDDITVTGSPKKPKKRLLGRIKVKKGIIQNIPDKEDERMTNQKHMELDQLFTPNSVISLPSYESTDESRSDNSSLYEMSSVSLDIDDLEIEDEAPQKSSTKTSLMSKAKRKVKGKEKSQKPDAVNEVQNADLPQVGRARTIDEIKASYGHGKEQNTTRGAADLRDKLLQQRQKIQAINKRSAEMKEGAQDFHKMAEELVRVLEEKNKRKFL